MKRKDYLTEGLEMKKMTIIASVNKEMKLIKINGNSFT